MRITLHDYVTDPGLPQKDGVNLAHENIAALMKGQTGGPLEVTFHDFNRLLEDDIYVREILSHTDCVISNVGPHAHYYFYLRQKYGLDFRIVRDVRTAIWSSYLLQEHLCGPFLREQDILMVASHYTRGIYEKIFPPLKNHATLRCYPLTVAFPPALPERLPTRPEDPVILGYIGRLSEDKNFPDLVELLIELNQTTPHLYKLLACGDIHSMNCHPQRVTERIRNTLGDGDWFEHLPPRHNGEIWELFRRFDAMVFPSTSNLETLGRVLIEASYAGLPVVCGAHAAAPELMPPSSLCRVNYTSGQRFSSHFDHCLGRVDIQQMAEALTSSELQPSRCHLDYFEHPKKFISALGMSSAEIRKLDPLELQQVQERFIGAIAMDMPQPLNKSQSIQIIGDLVPWFLTLQRKGSGERGALLEQLAAITRHPERTQRFIDKAEKTRSDFTNVGGIDIELCHVTGFYPRFQIDPSTAREAGDTQIPEKYSASRA